MLLRMLTIIATYAQHTQVFCASDPMHGCVGTQKHGPWHKSANFQTPFGTGMLFFSRNTPTKSCDYSCPRYKRLSTSNPESTPLQAGVSSAHACKGRPDLYSRVQHGSAYRSARYNHSDPWTISRNVFLDSRLLGLLQRILVATHTHQNVPICICKGA